jgi:spore maturation protein CgeB
MKMIFIGLSISSSWGNGHATTYRALLRELAEMGHEILFLEHDVPFYSSNRDMPSPSFCQLELFSSVKELKKDYLNAIQDADVVVLGSYVAHGIEVGRWVLDNARGITAFYDIDTPVTLAKLQSGDCQYLEPELIPKFNLYLSFTSGPTLTHIQNKYGSPAARELFCSVDTRLYYPEDTEIKWDMGYLGTYSHDRQPILEKLLCQPARLMPNSRFVVAGPQYPSSVRWPQNLERIEHMPPALHRNFYNSQRFTLNVTRADMVQAGYSPSVRLFEAAACGVPVISDYWEGIETIFEPGKEILISHSPEQTMQYLLSLSEEERWLIGDNALNKILKYHTSKSRAKQFIKHLQGVRKLAGIEF